jgi:pimeloyl-ACP methyl ester carboxylesterase
VDTASIRGATRARVVALVLIVLVGVGLAYVSLSAGDTTVSVPPGAQAGELTLEPCTYPTEDGAHQADCGTLVVDENRTAADSQLIALPVVRIRARAADPGVPVVWLEGGPGQSNMTFDYANRFAGDRDVVLVGYRGIDGSVRLDCPEVTSALKRSADFLSEPSFRAYGEAYRDCATRLSGEGVDVSSYGLVQQVDDMEMARAALGYERVDLLSQSAGTRTAMIYAWRHPERVHRSVQLAVNPPGNFLLDSETTDGLLERYAELCAGEAGCSRRTDDLAASLRRVSADLPGRWLFLPIKSANVRITSLYGLMETTQNAPLGSAASMFDAWLSAAEGDASGLWLTSVLADVLYPELFVWGQYAAGASADATHARDHYSTSRSQRHTDLADAATAFAWGGGHMLDSWPAAREVDGYGTVQTSAVETLLIGGELDFAIPPQIARTQLLPHLPNGHEVMLAESGHVASFWTEQTEAGTTLINTFLATGEVDDSLYRPQPVSFVPVTRYPTMGKVLLGGLLTLAVLAVASLAVMGRRVRQRREFGRVSGALLRSLFPVVLGLGGWCLGVLVVLATMPGVTIDNGLMAVLAVAIPIALAVYAGWASPDSAVRVRRIGFAASVTGALAGSWLGFQASSGFTALATTVLGAVAGANLLVIVLDITRAHAEHRPAPDVEAVEGPQPMHV